jgi:hypothetical protein
MKKLLLAAVVCVISWTPADAADRLSGTWTTGGAAPQTFVFKAAGDAFGGVVCGPCDDPASVFRVENGRFVDDDHLTFSVAHDRGPVKDRGPQLMTGTLSGNQLTLETRAEGRQTSSVTTRLKRVVEGFVPDTSNVKGSNLLTADAASPVSPIEGRWIAAGRNAQQNFVLKVRGQSVWGLICGPCTPEGVFLIDDGSFDGTTMKFYINHIDLPPASRAGVQRNIMTGTLTGNVMKFKWVREGAENQPGGEMTLIGPIRQDSATATR